MKDLPYFKFYVNSWITGDISLEDFSTRGLFIDLCAYYWSKECQLLKKQFEKKYPGIDISPLVETGVVKISGQNINISFLDEQLSEWKNLSKTNSNNGKKGGRPPKLKKPIESETKPTALFSESEMKAKKSNKEDSIEDKKIEDVVLTTSPTFFTLKMLSDLEFGVNEFTRYAVSQTKRSESELILLRIKFVEEQRALSKLSWPTAKDAKSHFISWCKKQVNNNMNYTPHRAAN